MPKLRTICERMSRALELSSTIRLEVDLFKTGADRKGVCDALLIGTTTIASTHGCILFGDRASVPLNHGAVFLAVS